MALAAPGCLGVASVERDENVICPSDINSYDVALAAPGRLGGASVEREENVICLNDPHS